MSRTARQLGLVAVLSVGLAATNGMASDVRYKGMCDASAAVTLDAQHFIVADDERDILRVYALGTAAEVGKVELTDYLGNRNSDGEPKEADLEGAARVGNVIFWVASHGRNKDGEVKKFRWRFFETVIDASGVVHPGSNPPYKKLREDLLELDATANLGLTLADTLPPKDFGFNIEGLAAGPSGSLFIGFRSPLVGGKSIVIPFTNPAAVLAGTEPKATFGEPVLLDLGGRGIRSFEQIGNRYLIVAGPSREKDDADTPQPAFVLYRWSGVAAEAPIPVDGTDFGGLGPEVIFAIGDPAVTMVLSDDGTMQVGGEDCKDAPQDSKSFGSMSIPDAD